MKWAFSMIIYTHTVCVYLNLSGESLVWTHNKCGATGQGCVPVGVSILLHLIIETEWWLVALSHHSSLPNVIMFVYLIALTPPVHSKQSGTARNLFTFYIVWLRQSLVRRKPFLIMQSNVNWIKLWLSRFISRHKRNQSITISWYTKYTCS